MEWLYISVLIFLGLNILTDLLIKYIKPEPRIIYGFGLVSLVSAIITAILAASYIVIDALIGSGPGIMLGFVPVAFLIVYYRLRGFRG